MKFPDLRFLHRRQFLHLAAGAAALPAMSSVAQAQAYPTRPVRIIVTAAAGGPSDMLARLIGPRLSERLGHQFIIENRPGGSNNIGVEAVVRAPADGHTLLLAISASTVNATLFDKLNFNFIRDIAPVAGIIRTLHIMAVNPSFPAKTVPEFIAYAKAHPGRVDFASGGSGTGLHMAGEMFKVMASVNMVHVPYRGEALAVTDLLGGQVQVMFTSPTVSIEHVRNGKLRALAVTTPMRWERLSDVPTVAEFVPGFESSGWFGVGVPRNTPADIVDKLNREINAALADPKIQARFADLGGTALSLSPAEFGKLIADDTERWGKVIRAGNIKLE